MEGVRVQRDIAETIRIDHPEASYGIFCFNSVGDLFVSSDWGFYGYAWRNTGESFKQFLAGTNSEYIVGKFAINHREVSGKKMPPHREKNLKILVDEFIKELKNAG
jgi:hypothetical protein